MLDRLRRRPVLEHPSAVFPQIHSPGGGLLHRLTAAVNPLSRTSGGAGALQPSMAGGGLSLAPGGEAVIDEAARAAAQARHKSLKADAEGALLILQKLEAQPQLQEYRVVRAAIRNATAVAFLTQQTTGLGLGYISGSGFVIRRLSRRPGHGQPCWSAPSYYRGHGLCVGVVAGYEYVQRVVCIQSRRVLERLTHGEAHLGLTATLMAGSDLLRDLAAHPTRMDSSSPDASLSFCMAAGAMANLSVRVGWTKQDRLMNRQLFGDLTLSGVTDVGSEQLMDWQETPPPEEFCELYHTLDRLSEAFRRPHISWAQ